MRICSYISIKVDNSTTKMTEIVCKLHIPKRKKGNKIKILGIADLLFLSILV